MATKRVDYRVFDEKCCIYTVKNIFLEGLLVSMFELVSGTEPSKMSRKHCHNTIIYIYMCMYIYLYLYIYISVCVTIQNKLAVWAATPREAGWIQLNPSLHSWTSTSSATARRSRSTAAVPAQARQLCLQRLIDPNKTFRQQSSYQVKVDPSNWYCFGFHNTILNMFLQMTSSRNTQHYFFTPVH